jgi:hypothetical protein
MLMRPSGCRLSNSTIEWAEECAVLQACKNDVFCLVECILFCRLCSFKKEQSCRLFCDCVLGMRHVDWSSVPAVAKPSASITG